MIQTWLPIYQKRLNDAISGYFESHHLMASSGVTLDFFHALRHAVEGGGKRLRPILAILAYEEISQGECPEYVIDGLIGIELMHCYTLVHDDLPAMDNDILRRGKPTVWKQYGETMAILVGDALQTMAFERLSSLGDIRIIRELALTLGDRGVVLGQVGDTLADQALYTLEDMMRVHDEKTGGFIASCLVIGGLLGGAREHEIEQYRELGILLGRAFQVRDDILDYEGDEDILGKTLGKDENQKKGLVSLLGITETKKILEEIGIQMDTILQDIKNQKLTEVKEYVMYREG